MPCYCDTPSEDNQAEIEKRCKVRMYFDAQQLLSADQIKKCNELKIGMFPQGNSNESLCKICKIMTKEQMELISAYYCDIKWNHNNLYDWYLKHCEDDSKYFETKQ